MEDIDYKYYVNTCFVHLYFIYTETSSFAFGYMSGISLKLSVSI